MSTSLSERIVKTDVLVVGAGVAGLFAAIRAKEAGVNVVVVDEAQSGFSGASARGAQWWRVIFPGDDIDRFAKETIEWSEYLADQDIVYAIVGESYDRFQALLRWGVEVMRDENGEIKTMLSDRPDSTEYKTRFVFPAPPGVPDHIGKMKQEALRLGVKFIDRVMVTDLLTADGKVAGAVGFHMREGDFYQFRAKAVVIATGTFSLPPKSYWGAGTGMAMALRAGAELINMEQSKGFQCAISDPRRGGSSSISSFYWDLGEWWGQKYINAKGEEFMENYELGRRLLGRRHWGPPWRLFIPAIVREWREGRGPCYQDLSGCPNYWERLRKFYDGYCDEFVREWDYAAKIRGNLPLREYWKTKFELRIGGAGYEAKGGVRVSVNSETHVPGFYAAGIVTNSCGGVGYTNAGSFTACFAQGHRAGLNAAEYAKTQPKPVVSEEQVKKLRRETYAPLERKQGITPDDLLAKGALIAYRYVDIIRDEARLKKGIEEMQELREEAPSLVAKDHHYLRKCHQAKDTMALYEIIARTALMRTESRADHYREDYPLMDNDNWLKWLVVRLGNGEIQITPEDIPFEEKGWKYKPEPGKIDLWRLKE